MEEKYPKILYHYTSIENLALILKNKTIRFNSLINVDDPTEIKTIDTEGIGKYCFCSCWTDQEESIPFWNMYTKDMHGVMIKMISFPFENHDEFLPYFAGGQTVNTYIPKEIFDSNNFYTIPTIPFLRKIKYTDNAKVKAFDKIYRRIDGTFDVTGNLNELGLYKAYAWEFQSEWRYSMVLLPHDKEGKLKINVSNKDEGLLQSYYDIKLKDEALKGIEIITGPKISNGERILIETLCEKFLPNAKINKSKLKIR